MEDNFLSFAAPDSSDNQRKIIHIDMDCFFAAIEMRAHPQLCQLPLAVGGSAQERGVLSSCNYLARQYGLRSGMSTSMAQRRCPDLVLLPVRMKEYQKVSRNIQRILQYYSNHLECGLDEAYVDVTGSCLYQGSATHIAASIRKTIYEAERLTASAGVAPNKLLAKIASDWNKPNGQFVVAPEAVPAFMHSLAVEKIPGVGPRTTASLHKMRIYTCKELQTLECSELMQLFGRFGYSLYFLCRGIDSSPVEPPGLPKSVGVEETFSINLNNINHCMVKLRDLFLELRRRMERYSNQQIHKIFVKVKFHNFRLTSVERICFQANLSAYEELLKIAYARDGGGIRLIGVGVIFSEEGPRTLPLPL